ncbi:MAG: MFS transporter [Negativicutes bacterium]|nr:MFS transporter [Negativicutes bacterium]
MTEPFRLLSKDFSFVCVANFLYFGSFYLLVPTLPQYVAGIGGSPGQIGLVMGALTLASVVVRPYFGKLADRYGLKKFMLLGAGFFSFFFLFYSQIQAFIPLYFLRVIHGFSHASFLVASAAYVADLAPAERRGEVIGIYGTSSVVAMAMFPAWGIAIVGQYGGFSALFTVSIVAAGSAFCLLLFVREIKPGKNRTDRMSLMEIARLRVVLVASLALFSGATVYGAILTFLPVYAVEQGLTNFGLFFSVYAASTLASRILAGKLSDRIGRNRVILPCMGLVAAAIFMLPLLGSIYLLAFIGVCFGLGFGAFMPTLNALVVDNTPPQHRGSVLGFFTSFMDIGITAGAVGLGLVGEHWGYATMFAIGGFVVVGGMMVFAAESRPGNKKLQEEK